MKRFICTTAILLFLCVPARADHSLTMEEAMDIILAHHGVETEMDVSSYLTLDAETMTREAAVAAVVRSYGVYPVEEPDHVWVDEAEQMEAYRPYIDYARRIGITAGVGGNRFDPERPITLEELSIMLARAEGAHLKPIYPLEYKGDLCRLLSADMQRGLSLVPPEILGAFYGEGRIITAVPGPIHRQGGTYMGWIWYEGNVELSVALNGRPYQNQDWTAVHELGHYLCHRTGAINRHAATEELSWLIATQGDYCDTDNQEFFAESFASSIFFPEETRDNMPTMWKLVSQFD